MKKNAYIIILLLCFVARDYSYAQDIHFSQFSMSPLNLNPAFTGFFDGDYRGAANYRSQWTTVPVSYSTTSLQADMRTDLKKMVSNRVGAGILFNHDVAGDSKYGTTQLYIPVSYIHKLSSDSNFFMSIGLQPGISSVGFKTNQLTFDNQWDGDAYNPALSSGENFPIMRRTYFDVNTGLVLQYQLKQRAAITFGTAISHLGTPKISYFKNEDITLDTKLNMYLSFTYPIAPQLDLNTEYLFEKQGKYKENVLGAKVSYIFPSNEINPVRQAVSIGMYLRTKDAPIFKIGYDYKQWQLGMSYDLNTSAFNAATNRRGAIEFGLIYIFKKDKPFITKKRACPIYM
ncbi:MAG TPA: PorP/SprF family type IX secretion system membrane protein [Bacteroidia bacterium]